MLNLNWKNGYRSSCFGRSLSASADINAVYKPALNLNNQFDAIENTLKKTGKQVLGLSSLSLQGANLPVIGGSIEELMFTLKSLIECLYLID